jgi:hypothetical protein
MNKNVMHRVPGFTAEQALEQGASTPYAGLALRSAGGGAVEPQGCNVFKAIGCAVSVAACSVACATGAGVPACAACFAGLGAGGCIDCL